jgi:hypothetical protein
MKKFYSIPFRTIFISLLFLVSCTVRRTVPVEEGWEFLGSRKVNFVRDVDELNVNNPQLFTALRFRVQNRDLKLNHLKIYFQNGDILEPNVNEDYFSGEESRVIELGSQGRAINRIEFRYRTIGKLLKGRAEVLVYGRRADYRNF